MTSRKTATPDAFLVNLFSLLSFFLDGDDTITGSNAADVLLGFEGNDILIGGSGGDNLQGGGGTDTASYATATSGVSAIMQATGSNTGDAAGDTYDSIENLIGSAFADVLYGTVALPMSSPAGAVTIALSAVAALTSSTVAKVSIPSATTAAITPCVPIFFCPQPTPITP